MRSLRIQLVLFSLLSTVGCERASNTLREISLICGDDYSGSVNYLRIESVDSKILGENDFEAFSFDGVDLTPVRISSRGCVEPSSKEDIIVRDVKNSSSAVFTLNQSGPNILRLIENDEVQVDFRCRVDAITRVLPNAKFSDFVSSNAQLSPRHTMVAKIKSEDGAFPNSELNFVHTDDWNSFLSSLPRGRVLKINFTVENILSRNGKTSKDCSIFIDSDAPSVDLKVKSESTSQIFSWRDLHNISLVKEEDSLVFESTSDDISQIEYCAKRLNDDFIETQIEKASEWRSSSLSSSCYEFNIVDRTRLFMLPVKGFWSVSYRAKDSAGNISLTKNKVIFVESGSKLQLIQSNAKNSIKSRLLEQKFSEAMTEIIELEESRRKLPTHYEQLKAKNFIYESMLTTLGRRSIGIPLESGSATGDHITFGPVSGQLIALEPEKRIIFFNSINGHVEKQKGISGSPLYRGIDISSDEQVIILQYFDYFEVWKLEGEQLLKIQTVEFSDMIHWVRFIDKGRSILVGGSTLRIYDSTSFQEVIKFDGPALASGRYPAATIDKSSNVYFVNSSKELVRLNTSTGQSATIIKIDDDIDISDVVASPDEKFIIFSDTTKGLWRIDLESSVLVSLDAPYGSRIERLAISPDGSKFATFAYSRDIHVRRSSDGTIENIITDFQTPVYEMAFSPDASKLAATSLSGKLKLWNLDDFLTSKKLEVKDFSSREFRWRDEKTLELGLNSSPGFRFNEIDSLTGNQKFVTNETAFKKREDSEDFFEPFSVEWCLASYRRNQESAVSCRHVFDIFSHRIVVSDDLKTAAQIYYVDDPKISILEILQIPEMSKMVSLEVPYITDFKLSRNGQVLFVASGPHIYALDTLTGSQLWRTTLDFELGYFWLSGDEQYLMIATGQFASLKIDAASGAIVGKTTWVSSGYAARSIRSLFTSENDKIMVTVFGSSEVSVWDIQRNEIIARLDSASSGLVTDRVALSPLGTKLAFAYNQDPPYKLVIWDIEFSRLLKTICELLSNTESKLKCEALVDTAS